MSAHDPSLGDPFTPAPGMLVLSASRIRDFDECPRRFVLRHVMRVPVLEDLDDEPAAMAGRRLHEELRSRHERTELHDADTAADPEGASDPWVIGRARAHAALCPRGDASYVGGELDLRWLITRKSLLLTGRVDAVWRHDDGLIEVRDYKSGACPTSLDDDVGAALYMLLATAALPHDGRVRVGYEALAGDEPTLVSIDATPARLRRAYDMVVGVAERIRVEKAFVARPAAHICVRCPFATMCPHAAPAR